MSFNIVPDYKLEPCDFALNCRVLQKLLDTKLVVTKECRACHWIDHIAKFSKCNYCYHDFCSESCLTACPNLAKDFNGNLCKACKVNPGSSKYVII